MAKPFTFPDTIASPAAQRSSMTRRLPCGQFEAAAALYFMGRRGLTVYATGSTRGQALGLANRATETSSNLRAALATGKARVVA